MANSTGAWVSASALTRAAFLARACCPGAGAGLALVVPPENISAPWPATPGAVALVLSSSTFMWPACIVALFSGLPWAALRSGPRRATA